MYNKKKSISKKIWIRIMTYIILSNNLKITQKNINYKRLIIYDAFDLKIFDKIIRINQIEWHVFSYCIFFIIIIILH